MITTLNTFNFIFSHFNLLQSNSSFKCYHFKLLYIIVYGLVEFFIWQYWFAAYGRFTIWIKRGIRITGWHMSTHNHAHVAVPTAQRTARECHRTMKLINFAANVYPIKWWNINNKSCIWVYVWCYNTWWEVKW